MSKKPISIIGGIIVIISFILISYTIQINSEYFKQNINQTTSGILIYISITLIATVIAPISAVPLLPLATFLWGWKLAGVYSIIGWTLGSTIAFLISKKFGRKLIKKIISKEKINSYEKIIPKKHLFSSIILMRIFLPVDLISYILGLSSKIKLKTYFFATLIGVTPFGFILAYTGSMPIKIQIIFILIGTPIFLILYLYYLKKI